MENYNTPGIAVLAPPGEQVALLAVVAVLGTLRFVLLIAMVEFLLSHDITEFWSTAPTQLFAKNYKIECMQCTQSNRRR